MECRCGDIARCRNDINTLSSLIGKLEALSADDDSIGNMLNNLAGCSEASVTPINIGELVAREITLHNPVSNGRNSIINQCRGELARLQSSCAHMEIEDRDYHFMIEQENTVTTKL